MATIPDPKLPLDQQQLQVLEQIAAAGGASMAVVPSADSTANDYESQVIGNKVDAAVTSVGTTASIMAYLKGLVNVEAAGAVVPTADASTNTYDRDVVGNKTDAAVTAGSTTGSLAAYAKGGLALLAAQSADATGATNVQDTVGNKADAAQTTVGTTRSLMGYLKGVVTAVITTLPGLHAVQTADAATNTNMRDVIGNKTDAAVAAAMTTKSVMAYVKGVLGWIGTITNTTGTATLGAVLGDFAGSDLFTKLGTLLTATGIGTTFVVKKTLTSSAILQTGVDVTGASSGGALELLNVILQTGGVGLAAGTNFQLVSNNANGALLFMAEAVVNLGTTKTVDLTTASLTKQKIVLESGKKITAKSTVADCTGAGTVDVYLVFRRNAAAATIAAAA